MDEGPRTGALDANQCAKVEPLDRSRSTCQRVARIYLFSGCASVEPAFRFEPLEGLDGRGQGLHRGTKLDDPDGPYEWGKNLMPYRLFIDDIRDPVSDDWRIARTSAEAIGLLEKLGCPREISFDHDLGGDDTAMVVVRWLIDRDLDSGGRFIPLNLIYSIH